MQPGNSAGLGGNLQVEAAFEEELSRCSLAAQQELGGNLQVEAVVEEELQTGSSAGAWR